MLAGCASSGGETAPGDSPPPALTPYHTATPLHAQLEPTKLATPTPLPLPTSTPFTYEVVQNDTLIGIAARFNTSLDALMLANPGVNPNVLSVGTELVIPPPSDEEEGGAPAEPTPAPLVESPPRCTPTPTGGLWCFWLVKNPHASGLENLAARVSLFDSRGEAVASQMAFPPLNLLPAGAALPLTTYFEPPAPAYEDIQIQLVSAIEVRGGKTRYLPASVADRTVTPAETGLSAQVSGTAALSDPQHPAAVVWVAAVAYDADGEVVGVRRWEGGAEAGAGQVPFSLLVSSVGPPIAYVEVWVEARPK